MVTPHRRPQDFSLDEKRKRVRAAHDDLKRLYDAARVTCLRIEDVLDVTFLPIVEMRSDKTQANWRKLFKKLDQMVAQHRAVLDALVGGNVLDCQHALRTQLLELMHPDAVETPAAKERRRAILLEYPVPFSSLLENSGDELEVICRDAIGDQWLLPPLDDPQHASMSEWVRTQSASGCSPLMLLRKCPQSCSRCWYRTSDALRLVESSLGMRPVAVHAGISPSMLDLALLEVVQPSTSTGHTLTSDIVTRMAAKHCGKRTANRRLAALVASDHILRLARGKYRRSEIGDQTLASHRRSPTRTS